MVKVKLIIRARFILSDESGLTYIIEESVSIVRVFPGVEDTIGLGLIFFSVEHFSSTVQLGEVKLATVLQGKRLDRVSRAGSWKFGVALSEKVPFT